jgi:hypothetical protein
MRIFMMRGLKPALVGAITYQPTIYDFKSFTTSLIPSGTTPAHIFLLGIPYHLH